MQLNTSTGYALQIMLYLAGHNRIVSSSELSEHINVSQRYLTHINKKLRKGGFIESHAGIHGGYSLLREAADISLYDIIVLMEGRLSIPESIIKNGSEKLHIVLDLIGEYLITYLRTITFDKLVDRDVNNWNIEIVNLVESHIDDLKEMT